MNAYTKGEEYYFENGTQYIGYIHTIKGKVYTGIKHVYAVSKRLYKPPKKDRRYTEQGIRYKPIIQEHYLNSNPIELATVPSQLQLTKSSFTIYVLKDITTKKIYEVTKKCYESLSQSKQYKTFRIKRKNGSSDSDIIFNKKQLRRVKDKLVQAYLVQKRGF